MVFYKNTIIFKTNALNHSATYPFNLKIQKGGNCEKNFNNFSFSLKLKEIFMLKKNF